MWGGRRGPAGMVSRSAAGGPASGRAAGRCRNRRGAGSPRPGHSCRRGPRGAAWCAADLTPRRRWWRRPRRPAGAPAGRCCPVPAHRSPVSGHRCPVTGVRSRAGPAASPGARRGRRGGGTAPGPEEPARCGRAAVRPRRVRAALRPCGPGAFADPGPRCRGPDRAAAPAPGGRASHPRAAATRAVTRRMSSPASGCHWTPSVRAAASGSSTASTVPSAAWAAGTRPAPRRSRAWWW